MLFQGVSRTLAAAWLAVALLAPSAPVSAASRTLESVVDVDTTASDATAARAQALETVEHDALKLLLEKMNPTGAGAVIANVTPQQAGSYSTGMEVMEEKITSNRYRAKIKVKFDAGKVEALLAPPAMPGMAAAPMAKSGSFLILPVLKDGVNTYLWEGENLWRSVWQSASLQHGNGNVVVPNGNQYDTALIDVANVWSAPFSLLQPMAERYGTSEVLVVEAIYSGTDVAPEVQLMARRLSATAREDSSAIYKAQNGETRETLLVRAANDMAKALSELGVAVAPPPSEPEVPLPEATGAPAEDQRVKVTSPLYQISDWVKLRSRLASVPLVQEVELTTLSAFEAKVELHYKGDPATLARQLTAAGFRVGTAADGWSIQ